MFFRKRAIYHLLYILYILYILGPFPPSCDSLCKKCSFHNQSHVLEADCSESNLTYFPLSLPKYISLVNLSSNHIERIEKQFIYVYSQISSLDISHNKLASLPKEMKKMTRLITLDLSHNHMISLPSSITYIPSLAHLDISHNKLTYLSTSVKHMRSLTHLDISHNHLTTLPNFVEEMVLLKEIRIVYNKFQCSCELLWLKHWISEAVQDYTLVRCKMESGKSIGLDWMSTVKMGCIQSSESQLLENIIFGKTLFK